MRIPITTLLLVEEHLEDALFVAALLDSAALKDHPSQYEMVHECSLADAAAALTQAQPDVILLGSMAGVPPMEGFEAVQAMAPEVPVIIFTRIADQEQAMCFLERGAQDYLVKERLNSWTLTQALSYVLHRHKMYAEKALYLKAYQASEARFRTLVNQHGDGILVVDKEGTVQFANRAAASLFGIPHDDLIDLPLGLPMHGRETTEIELVRGSGEPLVVEMRVVETLWNQETAYLASLREFTTRNTAHRALEKAHKHHEAILCAFPDRIVTLDEKGRVQEDYATPPDSGFAKTLVGKAMVDWIGQGAGVAFEGCLKEVWDTGQPKVLRHGLAHQQAGTVYETRLIPMASGQVMALSREVSAQVAQEEVHQQVFQKIGALVAHMEDLLAAGPDPEALEVLQDLLARTQELAAAFGMRTANGDGPCDVVAVAHEVMEEMMPLAAARGLHLNVTTTLGTPKAALEGDLLKRILKYLVHNGILFTPTGSVTLSIEHDSFALHLHVIDTGIGMAPDRLARLFVPVPTALAEAGAPLGIALTLVAQFMRIIGGRINVKSTPGAGSTVTLTLPVS